MKAYFFIRIYRYWSIRTNTDKSVDSTYKYLSWKSNQMTGYFYFYYNYAFSFLLEV